MAITLGGRGMVSPEINVTSLIDVLLVLLIIFMVLPPSAGERAQIPLKGEPSKEKAVIIQVKEPSTGQRPILKIDQEEIGWESFEARLEKIYSARRDKSAFVKGDPEIDFQYIAEVIDITHHAGVVNVGLLGKND